MRQGWCAGAVLTAVLALVAGAAPAVAAPVVVPADEVRRQLFVAADAGRLQRAPDGVRDLVLERLLQEVHVLEPGRDGRTTADELRSLRDGRASALPSPAELRAMAPNERFFAVLAAYDTPRPAGLLGRALGRVVRRALLESVDSGDPSDRFTIGADAASTLARGTFDDAATLRRSAELAERDAGFALARDQLWRAAAGVSVLAGQATLRRDSPTLRDPALAALLSRIGEDGVLRTTSEALEGEGRTALARLDRIGLDVREAGNRGGLSSDALAAARAGVRPARAALAATEGFVIETGNADAAVWTAILGDLVGDLVETTSDLAGGGLSATITGNYLSAALVISSFALEYTGVLGPSAEEVMLEQIVELRKQVAELRQEMHERFDDLEDVLVVVDAKLEDLRLAVQRAEGTVREVHASIGDLQRDFDRLRSNLLAANQAAREFETARQINRYLGYADRQSDGAALPAEGFADADSFFFTLGTTGARDDIALPPARSYAAEDVARELRGTGREQNTDYLRQWPARAGLPFGFGDVEVPNSFFWALGARAHGQLLLENPQRTTAEQLRRTDDLAAEGRKLGALVRRVRTGGQGGETGSVLFDALLARHREALGGAADPDAPRDGAVEAVRRAVLTHMADQTAPAPDARLGDPEGDGQQDATMPLAAAYDLFGGFDQAPPAAALPSFAAVDPCDPRPDPAFAPDAPESDLKIDLPAEVVAREVPSVLLNGRALGLWDLDVCWEGTPRTSEGSRSSLLDFQVFVTKVGSPRRTAFGAITSRGRLDPECLDNCRTFRSTMFQGHPCISTFSESKSGDLRKATMVVQSHNWEGREVVGDPSCGRVPQDLARRQHFIEDAFWQTSDVLEPFEEQVAQAVRPRQRAAYDAVLADVAAGGPTGRAMDRLAGTTALIDAYLDLALPQELATRDGLRALVRGTDATRLLDSEALTALLAAPIVPEEGDLNVERTAQRVQLTAGRPAALAAELAPLLTAPAARGSRAALAGETGSPLVDATLRRLTLTASVLRNPEPAPTPPPPAPTPPPPAPTPPAPTPPPGDGPDPAPAPPADGPEAPAPGPGAAPPGGSDPAATAPPPPAAGPATAAPAPAAPAAGPTGTPSRAPAAPKPPAVARPRGIRLLSRSFSRRRGTRLVLTAASATRVRVTARSGRRTVVKLLRVRRGVNRLAFGRRLPVGRWRATVVAVDGRGRASAATTLRFTVKR